MKNAANGLSRADASIQEFLSRMHDLLDALNEEGVEATTALRERIAVSIETLQPRLDSLRESIEDGAGAIDAVVQDHPWGAVAAGAVIGVAVGCAGAIGASALFADPDFVAKADQYRRGVARRYRPYGRRARNLANRYWPF